MLHLNFFPTGAPSPSTCMKCGDYRDLYDLGVNVFDGAALLCTKCMKDLAGVVGWVDPAALSEQLASATYELEASRAIINRIPNHVEELINGIRNSVADFVLTISGSSDDRRSVPVQGDVDGPEAAADNIKPAAGDGKAPRKSSSR